MNSQVIAQFISNDDVPLGTVIQLPVSITLESLKQLLPPNMPDKERMRMFVHGSEIISTLQDAQKKEKTSAEEILKIYCYPDDPPKKTRAPGYLASSCSGHTAAILSVKNSPCGKYVCSASGDGTVRFWCASTKTPIKSLKLFLHWIQCIQYSPDGKWLAAGSMDGGVSLISISDMSVIYSKKIHKGGVTAISWRSDSEIFSTASRDGSAGIWGEKGHIKSIFHEKPVIAVQYFGDYLLSAGRDTRVKVTDETGAVVQVLRGHAQWVTGMAVHMGKDSGLFIRRMSETEKSKTNLSESGKSYFVSISDDRTAIMWRPVWSDDGKWEFLPARKLVGHRDVLTSVSISSSGAYIATSSFDRSVKLWTSVNGYLSHTFQGHTSLAYQTVFSESGNLLVSCSADKTVKVYSVEKKTLLSDFVCKDQVFAVDIHGSMIVAGGKDRLVYFFT
ncbi:ribosome assembly protein 4 [Nematocida minor]|uniref:ribosome assembly protein 4 n=1 Tax=Nematocida minor TaxID=1912983 RepID=UPI00221E7C82|nr:ribosome assembly protein 4 [Nematocida minor]KAI5192995.1 ribosome assembly protein 4 [Nematocida minor]